MFSKYIDENKLFPNYKAFTYSKYGQEIIHKVIAEVIEKLKIREKITAVDSSGFYLLNDLYFDFDMAHSAHGRALSVAQGIKKVFPENIIFTYQIDNDLTDTGISELIHSAQSGENITCIFVNSTSSQQNIKIAELISSLPGTAFSSRDTIETEKSIKKMKKNLEACLLAQINNLGFSLIEIMAIAPSEKKEEENKKHFPIKIFKKFKEGK